MYPITGDGPKYILAYLTFHYIIITAQKCVLNFCTKRKHQSPLIGGLLVLGFVTTCIPVMKGYGYNLGRVGEVLCGFILILWPDSSPTH